MSLKLFVPITKVDVATRRVWGRAAEETPDKASEIFDYATSKPEFEKWSDGIRKATESTGAEVSLGNVRAMHGKVAAGKLTQIDFVDAEKAIDVVAEIVDDNEWAKVEKGVYTGFSIGGDYLKKWRDGGDQTLTRYTAGPSEISIVDNPCVPTARFTMVKADGIAEQHEFAPADSPLRKGLYDVARLASILDDVKWLTSGAAYEAQAEGDASTMPGDLKAWLAMGLDLLPKMAAEETSEVAAAIEQAVAAAEIDGAALALAKPAGDLAKAGARHSKADMEHLQSAHDHLTAMGATCATGDEAEKAARADLQKRADETVAKLESVTSELTKLAGERDALAKRVTELEALPLPPKGVARIVEKTSDAGALEAGKSAALAKIDDDLAKTNDPEQRAMLEIKRIHLVGQLGE